MARLSDSLAKLATHIVRERHKDEARAEAHQLRRTLERLIERGVSDSELLSVLKHDHWENRLALRMADLEVAHTSASSNPFLSGVCP